MNQGGRIVLLASAVVLLIIGVVCLKQRLGDQEAPPAFVPGEVTTGPAVENHVTHQPTILSAEPAREIDSARHPSWQDADVLPASDLVPNEGPTFPVRTTTPMGDPFTPWQESTSTQAETPFGQNSVPQPAQPAPLPPEILPSMQQAVVITKQDDSLWTIAEQAYGQGLYYQALYALNKDRIPRPDRIEAGIEVLTPPLEELHRQYPDLCPISRDKRGS